VTTCYCHTLTALEIGAGLGHLTQQLATAAGRVVAVELDERFIPILRLGLASFPGVTLVHGDILAVDLPALLFPTAAPLTGSGDSYKVVANVPYYITGAILRKLFEGAITPSLVVLTVQKEVAERLTAQPGQLSLLAVSVQFYGEVRLVDTIKAGAFWPRPEVDSAIVVIDCRQRNRVNVPTSLFFTIVKMGFSQKRKQIHKNLRGLGLSREVIGQGLENAGIPPTLRAQSLTLSQWESLTTFFAAYLN